MKKNIILRNVAIIAVTFSLLGSASSANSVFVAYEFGEMAFNNFKNFAGEIGYNFDNKHSVRLSYMNVALSEITSFEQWD